MSNSATETTAITMADVSEAIRDNRLRADFVTRVRVHFESDAEALVWLTTKNCVYHGQAPWELFYGEPVRQGAYLDATCNVFCQSLYKRLPAELPALPPAPSED